MKRRTFSSSAGFTLLEIMLVVAIIILLLGGAIYKMRGSLDTAKMARAQGDIETLKIALTSYESLGGSLPTTSQGLAALVTRPSSEPRPRAWVQGMDSLMKDPWNNDYYYEQPGKHNTTSFDLYSAGPDKQPGTEDDVVNWRR